MDSTITFDSIPEGFLGHYRKLGEDAKPSYFHYHDVYELYYFLDGERNYLTHNDIYPLKSDWITLTKPYVIHGTNGKQYERLLIFFSENFLETYFQPPLIQLFHEVFSVDALPASSIRKNPKIKELFFLIAKYSDEKNLKMAAMHLGTLLLFLHETISQLPKQAITSTLPQNFQNILSYISNNFATIKSLDQVAEHFFLSKSHLFRLFKTHAGFTFVEFLTKVRLSNAQYLLEHTNNTINEISETCGFETPAYFCIVFKRKMNMTPLQYRTWISKKNK